MTYGARDGRTDYEMAMELLADHADHGRSLITQRFPLDDVHSAFAAALDKASQSIKVHIRPND